MLEDQIDEALEHSVQVGRVELGAFETGERVLSDELIESAQIDGAALDPELQFDLIAAGIEVGESQSWSRAVGQGEGVEAPGAVEQCGQPDVERFDPLAQSARCAALFEHPAPRIGSGKRGGEAVSARVGVIGSLRCVLSRRPFQ
jgi:hypothetical protein